MPVAQFQGRITVPLWQHPFSNPFGSQVPLNCLLGTVNNCQITPATSGGNPNGYTQPAVATWRGRNYTLCSNTGNTNIGQQNQLYDQAYAVSKKKLFWINSNGTNGYNTLGIPDAQGTITRYPASVSGSKALGAANQYTSAPSNGSTTIYGSAKGDPAAYNAVLYESVDGPGYIVNDIPNPTVAAGVFTNFGIPFSQLTLTNLGACIGSLRYSTDDTFFLSFLSAYPQYALVQFNYSKYIASSTPATFSTVSFDSGANYWTAAANSGTGWNETANGFIYLSSAALNGIPYTAVFVSQDFTKWWQIVLLPQDAASAGNVASIGASYVKLMQDDQGTWYLSAPSPSLVVAVSLPPPGSTIPSTPAPNTTQQLPVVLPCVDLC